MPDIPFTVFIIAEQNESAEKTYNNLKAQNLESGVTFITSQNKKPLNGKF